MKNQALMIGGFIIGALAIAVAVVIWLSGGNMFDKKVAVVIYFHDGVRGLYAGAPVTFRGVPVGLVKSIGLELDRRDLTARIPVHIVVIPDIVTLTGKENPSLGPVELPVLVSHGLRAKLVSDSLITGQKSIELNIVPDAAPVALAAGDVPEIPAVTDRFAALTDQMADLPLREIAEELRSTMKKLRTTLDTANTTLQGAGQELGGVGAQARKTLSTANEAILRVQNKSSVTLDAVTRLADNANGTVTDIKPDLMRTLSSTRDAAESARVAMARVAELTAPGAPLRGDLEGAIADLAQATRNLRDWSEVLQEQPNAIIFGRKRKP
jgi:phospholipid/cholesterol/gamma-HCH transport system substrate-binding protein